MKKKQLKEYCVHIYEEYHEAEGIMASSPEEAERKAIRSFNSMGYGKISSVEVMRVCHCDDSLATDNDITNKVCDNCGKKL